MKNESNHFICVLSQCNPSTIVSRELFAAYQVGCCPLLFRNLKGEFLMDLDLSQDRLLWRRDPDGETVAQCLFYVHQHPNGKLFVGFKAMSPLVLLALDQQTD